MKNNIDKMNATVLGHLRSQLTPYHDTMPELLDSRIQNRLESISANEMFDLYLKEIGVIGFTSQIVHALAEINKACNSNLGE